MRLINYINETKEYITEINDPDEAIKILRKNCSKYIKETKGNWFLRGGMTALKEYDLGFRRIRIARKPKGMSPRTFGYFNEWLQSSGHVKRNEAISVTGDKVHAKRFIFSGNDLLNVRSGKIVVIFMKGNYNYTWVKTQDINITSDKWYGNMTRDFLTVIYDLPGNLTGSFELQRKWLMKNDDTVDSFEAKNQEIKELVLKTFPKYFTSNKGMQIAYKKKYEIWFSGPGYYYIKIDSDLHKYLRKFL